MEEDNSKKQFGNAYVLGINLSILAVYTILSKLVSQGFIIDAIFITFQFFGCLVIALIQRRWIWVLSAFVVLLIGVSTCINLMGVA